MNQPQSSARAHNPRMALIAGGASIITVIILIVMQLIAYLENGSASVLAALIDSFVDGGVAIMTFMAIKISLKPPDSEHRYGHGKVEGLAAIIQAAFVAAAGFFLLLQTISRFFSPVSPLEKGVMLAITVMAVSTVLSLMLIVIQKYSLLHAPSLAVESDKAHYSGDIVVNLGVIAVLLAARAGAPIWIDPLFAIGVAVYLGFTVKHIAGKGLDMLLDRELPDTQREIITAKVLDHPGVLGMHDLRTHKSGMRVFMSFDIELDPSLLLYHAHEIVRQVEHELLAQFPNAEILIHADPHGDTHDTRHNVEGAHHF